MEAIVDAADAPLVSGRNWYALAAGRTFYAVAKTSSKAGPRRLVSLHRTIMEGVETPTIDHRDGDGLNCRRSNLRAATVAENTRNRRRPIAASDEPKGVSFHRKARAWQAQIKHDGICTYLGLFATPTAAHAAYCEASSRLHGEFGRTA